MRQMVIQSVTFHSTSNSPKELRLYLKQKKRNLLAYKEKSGAVCFRIDSGFIFLFYE